MVDWAESRDKNLLELLKGAIVTVAVVNDQFGGRGMRLIDVWGLDVEPPERTGGADVQAGCGMNDPLGVLVRVVCDGGLPAEVTNGGMCV